VRNHLQSLLMCWWCRQLYIHRIYKTTVG